MVWLSAKNGDEITEELRRTSRNFLVHLTSQHAGAHCRVYILISAQLHSQVLGRK